MQDNKISARSHATTISVTSYIGQETGNQFGMGVYNRPPTSFFRILSEKQQMKFHWLTAFMTEALKIGLAIVCGMRCVFTLWNTQ